MTTTPDTTPAATIPARKPLRVLYAEDMPALRDLLVVVLGRDGHQVETVANGDHALQLVAANPTEFDLVITDHHMPVMNGLELVSRLRHMAYGGKIIVFSSELSQAVDASYREMKVDRILPKPVFPAEIRATVAAL